MLRTKITGYLLIIVAVLKAGIDVLDGGSFNLNEHLDSMFIALNGAGFIFLRDAVSKVKNVVEKK